MKFKNFSKRNEFIRENCVVNLIQSNIMQCCAVTRYNLIQCSAVKRRTLKWNVVQDGTVEQ